MFRGHKRKMVYLPPPASSSLSHIYYVFVWRRKWVESTEHFVIPIFFFSSFSLFVSYIQFLHPCPQIHDSKLICLLFCSLSLSDPDLTGLSLTLFLPPQIFQLVLSLLLLLHHSHSLAPRRLPQFPFVITVGRSLSSILA